MTVETMVDEYYERYRRQPHEELFRQLMAGLPTQVDTVAAGWRKAENAIGSLATELRADLARLALTWTGTGSREYQYRLGLVVAYAEKLAEEATAMRTGLEVMSGSLADAQRRAAPDQPEPPAPQVDAATAVLGGLTALGRTMSDDERAKARERVAAIVARLAADYAIADHRAWPASMPVEPPGMPAGSGTPTPVATGSSIVETDGVTALAGDGVFTGAPAGTAAGTLAGPPAATPAGSVTSLVGAAPVLGGSARHVTGHSGSGQSTGTAGAAPMGMMPPPMAGGVIGGRPADGYAITDPRVADESTAWSAEDTVDRDQSLDAPPSILGKPAT